MCKFEWLLFITALSLLLRRKLPWVLAVASVETKLQCFAIFLVVQMKVTSDRQQADTVMDDSIAI